MSNKILSLMLMVAAIVLLGSCLSSDDDNQPEYYNDTALQSFTLGSTINRYYHVRTASGNDSLVMATFSGSSYTMAIDHQRGLVYNTDSLPYGTDLRHVLVTVEAYRGGTAVIKDIASDTLRYISSTDSIDFSQPREIRVYSQSRTAMRTYTVTLTAHQAPTDSTVWSQMATSAELGQLSPKKAVSLGGNIYVFGQQDGHTMVYATAEDDGSQWTLLSSSLGTEASANALAANGKLYVLDGTQLKTSTDGRTFEAAGSTPLLRLVAASTRHLYALDANSQLVESTDDGQTWTASPIDDSASLLPTDNIGYTCYQSAINTETDNLMIVGTRAAGTDDNLTYAWTRVEEYGADATNYPWSYVVDGGYRTHRLPCMSSLTVLPVAGGALAMGGAGAEGSGVEAFSHMYLSIDGGINWRTDTHYMFPYGFQSSSDGFTATVDSKGRFWLIAGQTGQVWRGFLLESK